MTELNTATVVYTAVNKSDLAFSCGLGEKLLKEQT